MSIICSPAVLFYFLILAVCFLYFIFFERLSIRFFPYLQVFLPTGFLLLTLVEKCIPVKPDLFSLNRHHIESARCIDIQTFLCQIPGCHPGDLSLFPQIYGCLLYTSPKIRCTITPAINTLKQSPSSVIAPAFAPSVRSALVVPEFPLPYLRISIPCTFPYR